MNTQLRNIFGAVKTLTGSTQTRRDFRSEFADRIICGDARRVLTTFPAESIDLVFTDPPYVVGYRPRDGRSVSGDNSAGWIEPAFREIYRVLKRDSLCISSYGWHCADAFFTTWRKVGFICVGHIVWIKPYTSGQRFLRYQHEQAFLLAKGHPRLPRRPLNDVLPWEYTGNKLHPTQKPVGSLRPLIETFTQPGDIVLDPFCGSGSTLEAAAQLGRHYIGIEVVWKYWNIANKRLSNV